VSSIVSYFLIIVIIKAYCDHHSTFLYCFVSRIPYELLTRCKNIISGIHRTDEFLINGEVTGLAGVGGEGIVLGSS